MKLLILSDLHISVEIVSSQFKLGKYKRILENQISSDYDLVLISGDVFEHQVPQYVNVFETLQYLFNDKPVVFCLGNHEFAYEDYNSVLKTYKTQYEVFISKHPDGKVICLDVSDYFDFGNNRIVGNVFWYDWSLNNCRTLMKGELLDGFWLDATIKNFYPMKEHEKCRQKILDHIDTKKNMILLTHCVPHESLNTFSYEQPNSLYNAYSGTKDFLKELKDKNFKFVFCGHTHRKENREIYGMKCINIGNDYLFRSNKIEHMILDVDDDLNIKDLTK